MKTYDNQPKPETINYNTPHNHNVMDPLDFKTHKHTHKTGAIEMIIQENTKEKILSVGAAHKIIKSLLEARPEEEQHKEYFYSLGLNPQNQIEYVSLEATGTVDQCIPFIREILRTALLRNATGLIIAHNHPSGTPQPSTPDRTFTKKLGNACDLMGIKLLDHVIAAGDRYYSFADDGSLGF